MLTLRLGSGQAPSKIAKGEAASFVVAQEEASLPSKTKLSAASCPPLARNAKDGAASSVAPQRWASPLECVTRRRRGT